MNRFQHDNIDPTITGKRRLMGLYNGKPYRTAAQKKRAKETAWKHPDGAWRSNAPVSYHPRPKG